MSLTGPVAPHKARRAHQFRQRLVQPAQDDVLELDRNVECWLDSDRFRVEQCARHQHGAPEEPGGHGVADLSIPKLHAEQQPLTTHLDNQFRIARPNLAQAFQQIVAAAGCLPREILLQHHVDGGDAGRACERVAPERR